MRWRFCLFGLRRRRLPHQRAEDRVRDLNGGWPHTRSTPRCPRSPRLISFLGWRGSRFCPARPSFRFPLGATVTLVLYLLGLGDAHESFRIDVGETLPHVGDLRPFDAPRDAVDAAMPVDRHEVAPVAPRQHPALLLKRRLKFLAAFGRLPDAGHQFLGLFGTDASPRGLQHFAVARRSFWSVLAFALDVCALHPLKPELFFEGAGDLFV